MNAESAHGYGWMCGCANGGSWAEHSNPVGVQTQTNANEFMPNGGIVVLLFAPVAVATSHCCTVSLSILSLIIK